MIKVCNKFVLEFQGGSSFWLWFMWHTLAVCTPLINSSNSYHEFRILEYVWKQFFNGGINWVIIQKRNCRGWLIRTIPRLVSLQMNEKSFFHSSIFSILLFPHLLVAGICLVYRNIEKHFRIRCWKLEKWIFRCNCAIKTSISLN